MQTFNLPTMSCGHCEKKVRETIASLDPDADVKVDLSTRTVSVESAVGRDRIADALKA
ncbi:MAG: heavy-metal-associated domain-containing protein [Oceanicaulis sp.]|nr:heavy-metal-associated domain-containing protein [Oceanicaulis sp.]